MGISTNAIIAFGIDLGEEYPLDRDDDDDRIELDEFLAKKAGLVDPYDTDHYPADRPEYSLDGKQDEWDKAHPEWVAKRDVYWEAKRNFEKAAPIEFISHCSHDYPMWVMALRGTQKSAYRGSPEKLGTQLKWDYHDLKARIEEANQFCEEHGFPPFEDPEWLLFSDWG